MLLEPDERERTPERLRARLESQDAAGSFDLVAERDGGLPGWLSAEVLPLRRARRCGYLVMGWTRRRQAADSGRPGSRPPPRRPRGGDCAGWSSRS